MGTGNANGLPTSDWMTTGQAASVLGVTPERVRQLCDDGTLPASRSPLGRMVDANAVAALRVQRESRKARQ